MLLAITNQGKVGLGVLAGLLIVFAILSAFYFPRRNPDFPGDRLGLFVLVSVILFVATMAGVVVFAKEEEEAHGAEATETHATETGEEPRPPSGAQRAGRRPGCGQVRLRLGGLRRVPHARGGRIDRPGRPQSGRVEARRGARRRPRHERHGSDAVVQGTARREADPGRGGLRRRLHQRLDTLSLARRGVRAAEGARLEIA